MKLIIVLSMISMIQCQLKWARKDGTAESICTVKSETTNDVDIEAVIVMPYPRTPQVYFVTGKKLGPQFTLYWPLMKRDGGLWEVITGLNGVQLLRGDYRSYTGLPTYHQFSRLICVTRFDFYFTDPNRQFVYYYAIDRYTPEETRYTQWRPYYRDILYKDMSYSEFLVQPDGAMGDPNGYKYFYTHTKESDYWAKRDVPLQGCAYGFNYRHNHGDRFYFVANDKLYGRKHERGPQLIGMDVLLEIPINTKILNLKLNAVFYAGQKQSGDQAFYVVANKTTIYPLIPAGNGSESEAWLKGATLGDPISTGQFFNCKSKPRPLSTTMIPPSNTTEIDQDTEEGDSDNLLMYIFIVVGIIVLLFIAGAAFCFLKMRKDAESGNGTTTTSGTTSRSSKVSKSGTSATRNKKSKDFSRKSKAKTNVSSTKKVVSKIKATSQASAKRVPKAKRVSQKNHAKGKP